MGGVQGGYGERLSVSLKEVLANLRSVKQGLAQAICPSSLHVFCGFGEGLRPCSPGEVLWGVLWEYGVPRLLLQLVPHSLSDLQKFSFWA